MIDVVVINNGLNALKLKQNIHNIFSTPCVVVVDDFFQLFSAS